MWVRYWSGLILHAVPSAVERIGSDFTLETTHTHTFRGKHGAEINVPHVPAQKSMLYLPVSSQRLSQKMWATATLCHGSESHTRAGKQMCILTCTVTKIRAHAGLLVSLQHKSAHRGTKTPNLFTQTYYTSLHLHTQTFLTLLLGSGIVRLECTVCPSAGSVSQISSALKCHGLCIAQNHYFITAVIRKNAFVLQRKDEKQNYDWTHALMLWPKKFKAKSVKWRKCIDHKALWDCMY